MDILKKLYELLPDSLIGLDELGSAIDIGSEMIGGLGNQVGRVVDRASEADSIEGIIQALESPITERDDSLNRGLEALIGYRLTDPPTAPTESQPTQTAGDGVSLAMAMMAEQDKIDRETKGAEAKQIEELVTRLVGGSSSNSQVFAALGDTNSLDLPLEDIVGSNTDALPIDPYSGLPAEASSGQFSRTSRSIGERAHIESAIKMGVPPQLAEELSDQGLTALEMASAMKEIQPNDDMEKLKLLVEALTSDNIDPGKLELILAALGGSISMSQLANIKVDNKKE